MSRHIKHQPLGYGRKLYIAEFLAERIIQVIAILSIGFIIAIFYYVFQESVYAFTTEATAGHNAIDRADTPGSQPGTEQAELKQETYSPEGSQSGNGSNGGQEQYKPETYSPDASASGQTGGLKPESYGSDKAGGIADAPDGAAGTQTASAAEDDPQPVNPAGSEMEQKLTVSKLIQPNDYIDDKPAYVWQPISTIPKYSFIPLMLGALKVTLIAIIIGAPIAILAAIFTVAFAPKWLKEIIKPAIEILAGFPSIVIGFFCLMTLATLVQDTFGTTYRLNSFVGGIGMSLAIIPIIYTVTEDALSAIPKYMSEASLALGASKWETAWRVLLPAATPGVFAAVTLGFGRAFGETMIALMATGNAALVSADIFESVRTMAATIGAEMAEVEFRSTHYGVLFLIGSVLFIVTFSLNAIAEFYVRRKLLKKFQGN